MHETFVYSPHLFMYSIIYIMWSHVYYIFWIVIQYCIFFLFKLSQFWLGEALSGGSCIPLLDPSKVLHAGLSSIFPGPTLETVLMAI
jgi:hypothetical protein